MSDKRISKRQLLEMNGNFSGRDKNILYTIQRCRYITSGQLQRLFFTDAATSAAALRAVNRNLEKLKDLGLIEALPRRMGGTRGGSGAHIWHLRPPGEHLLRLTGSVAKLSRSFTPSIQFLTHTLATTECFVRLHEISRGDGLELKTISLEPECWRMYNHAGKLVSIKPDIFAVTTYGGYQDSWFIELDLDTEAPVRIIDKCHRYHQYYRSGLEQKQHDVFPLVIWIVPDKKREESIKKHLRDEFSAWPNLFEVIVLDELENLLRQDTNGALSFEEIATDKTNTIQQSR